MKSKKLLRTIYLIIDGMTETEKFNSTLSLSRTPTMNGLIDSHSIMGFYDPVIRPGDTEPKTDVVIPFFFGLGIQQNPGRIALELIDNNIQIKPEMHFVEIKIRFLNQVNEENWVKLKKIPDTLTRKIEKELAVSLKSDNFILSKATESGARILLYSDNLFFLDQAFFIINDICYKYNLIAIKGSRNQAPRQFSSFQSSQKNILFIGWAKGSLRGALKLCGLDVNEFSRKRGDFYNWTKYYKNFDEWAKTILKTKNQYEKLVLYTKESAFAARRGNKFKKQEAIEFMDNMLEKLLAVSRSEMFNIIVLSDHSANIGGISNPTKNTAFAILRGSYETINKNNSVNFSENFIAKNQGKIITQEEVISLIAKRTI